MQAAPQDVLVDVPIPYMERTRTYYRALGYAEPYRWAHFADVPFARLGKPLAECRIGLATTAVLHDPAKGDQGPGAPYNAAAKFHRVYAAGIDGAPDTRIAHVTYDRAHTSAIDANCWFPLAQLKRCAELGLIGTVSTRFYGVPTTRSQRSTLERDAPELLALARADAVDAMVLVPNCPICHQTMSLAARHLEAAGIPTVILGCAKDIVEHVGVPRFLFSDFPLGNACGKPLDSGSQIFTIDLAFELLAMAPAPRTTIQSPLRWCADAAWKRDFCRIDGLAEADLARLRAAHEDHRATARAAAEPRARTHEDRRFVPLRLPHLPGGSRSGEGGSVPLQRLPEILRLGLPRHRAVGARQLPPADGPAQDLCEDRRQR